MIGDFSRLGKNGIILLGLALLTLSCEDLLVKGPPDDELLDGPVSGLSSGELDRFIKGDVAFNDDIFTPETGLGPIFVSTSCGSCHPGDGKGHPFTTLTRFGQNDDSGNQFLEKGGPQLQHRSIPGYLPESIPSGAPFAKFMPPANTGLGFLDAVTDSDILALADETDVDGDGISGVPNWIVIPDYVTLRPDAISQNGKYIGRIGKKAAAYDLLQQTANAYNQDIGITSSFEPFDTATGAAIDPEISDQAIDDVVFYLKTLKAPIQRNQNQTNIIEGKNLFVQIGCSSCHLPEMKTGYSPISSLSFKTFSAYTDLLLHDMGQELDDGYTEGSAKTSEWRTPPLWGLGLAKNSQGGELFLLHDGRAKSISEAILLHGGEGDVSRTKYQGLTDNEKQLLIKFLESL